MKRQLFTLIELLVSVAIIGILASLLLPSLSKARNRAKDAVCLSNQKQIGILMAVYTASETNIMPNHRLDGSNGWAELIDQEMTEELYLCPRIDKWTYADGSICEPDVSSPSSRIHKMTYGYNGWWLGLFLYNVGSWGQPMSRNYIFVTDAVSPDRLIVTSDSKPLRSGANYRWGSSIWYPFRRSNGDANEGVYSTHGPRMNRSNLLYMDGHVQSHVGSAVNFNSTNNDMWNPDVDTWMTSYD